MQLTSDQLFHLEKFMEKSAKQIAVLTNLKLTGSLQTWTHIDFQVKSELFLPASLVESEIWYEVILLSAL